MNMVLIPILLVLSVITVIPAMAQEDDCVEMDIEIESTKNLDWTTCYLEEYASLLIKTSSEEPTDNKIILQKDIFWNYDVDCSPTRFFTLINGEEIYQQEEYFDDYRILSVPLEKGENEVEIIIATIPGMSANEYCLTEYVEPMLDLSEGAVDCVGGYYFNGTSCVLEPNCPPNTKLTDGVCEIIDNGCEPDMYGNIYCDDMAREDGQKINLKNAIEYFFGRGNYEGVIHYENYLIFLIIPVTIILVLIWRKRK